MLARFLASQLRRPSGWFGRLIMTRMLNRGNRELIAATLEALELQAEDRFLDVGFGGGEALARAAHLITEGGLVGVDFSPDVVAQGQVKLKELIAAGRLQLFEADVEALPLDDERFSKIATTNTIYFWRDPQGAMANLKRLLRPAGLLAIGFTGADKMQKFRHIANPNHGFRHWTTDEVIALAEAAGFAEVACITLDGRTTRGDFVVRCMG